MTAWESLVLKVCLDQIKCKNTSPTYQDFSTDTGLLALKGCWKLEEEDRLKHLRQDILESDGGSEVNL